MNIILMFICNIIETQKIPNLSKIGHLMIKKYDFHSSIQSDMKKNMDSNSGTGFLNRMR